MRSRLLAAPLLLLGVAPPLLAQTRQVTGTVVSAASEAPLENITIAVAGGAATRTNARGQYRLTVPDGEVTLVARGIGYQRLTRRLPPTVSVADFRLQKDVLQLDQVVVTGQSTTTERRNATTATTVLAADEVLRAPAPALEQALQGKVVGANINMNSGAPGGGAQVQIRGITSILGQGDPLFVVDGVIISNNSTSSGTNSIQRASTSTAGSAIGTNQDNVVNRLADLNPAEIESIEVLKSAAATAIYGSRATNGVVVIRTKRGQAGQTRATLVQRVGTQQPLRTIGQRRFTTLDQALAYGRARNEPEALIRRTAGDGPLQFNDFQDQLYSQTSPSYETVLGISGGGDRTSYSASATQRSERGTAIETGARLQSLRLNLDQTFNARLRGSIGLNVTRNLLFRGLSNNDNSKTSPLYNFGYTPSFFDMRQRPDGSFPVNEFSGGAANTSNPFQTFSLLGMNEDVYRQFGTAQLTWTALESARHRVEVNAMAGLDRSQQGGIIQSPGFLQYELNDGLPGTNTQSNADTRNVNSSVGATHTFTPASAGFTVTTSVGATFEEQQQNLFRVQGLGTLPGIGRSDVGGVTRTFQQYFLFRDQSAFANTSLSAFSERLNVNAGVRADRSSANGDPAKLYFFPRVSAAYRFDDIAPGVDNVKLRVGYGQTGNRPRYADRDILFQNAGVMAGRTGFSPNPLVGNAAIRPETLVEQEVGFDAQFVKGRVALEATYFNRRITNQLLQPALTPSTGLGNLVINAGELATRGTELALNAIPIQTRRFNWTSRVTYQTYVAEVERLPAVVPPFNAPNSFGASYGRNRITQGARATAIWGNAPVRIENGRVVEILPKGSYVTNPSAISAARDTIIGDANPDFQMFFTNTVRYRAFQVGVLLDWRQGGDMANMTNNLWDEGNNSRDFDAPSGVIDARPNSATRGQPLTMGQYRYAAWNAGTDTRMYVQDGSYLKIRELSLTADVPASLARRISPRISSLQLQVQARNPFVFTDYWGADPEANNFGISNLNRFIDLAPYPPTRQFFLGLNLGI